MIWIGDLLQAYREGFFPMYDPDDGNTYWCRPERRALFRLDSWHPSRELRRTIRRGLFEVTLNRDFSGVIRGCASPRKGEPQTWISDDIIESFEELHRLGFAHSVECWQEGELAGGLYGMALGGAFFGESMFHRRTSASKVAFAFLVGLLRERGFTLLDAQVMNPHLERLGAYEVDHEEYMAQLAGALAEKSVFL